MNFPIVPVSDRFDCVCVGTYDAKHLQLSGYSGATAEKHFVLDADKTSVSINVTCCFSCPLLYQIIPKEKELAAIRIFQKCCFQFKLISSTVTRVSRNRIYDRSHTGQMF